ncbi:putative g-patch rna maturation protein [Neofusicoccum parvum UCRNP2]|uniref:PinX1-related protein 1 n=1 Tax=Botryosphaeria parva (strain UCR-NP2) TaxID=1287680 RepID=R1GH33_BOTPV|nr:putative g-patch rna maturation protein [Neofusicoccum parvum UCRNP2]
MGLAGPKNRTKLSADPNNTHWSKSTDRFGHKILRKQGWTPGEYLGAKDAKHSSHYTAANASHIRVAVKDDNLGLGAKRGKAENETFGLSAFQGLLGRLNGKSDGELKKEESAQRDLKLQLYQNQRWGSIRFVSGGLLVGDKIEKLLEDDKVRGAQLARDPVLDSESADGEKTEKKRKRSEDDESAPKLKRKKRKSDLKKDLEVSSHDDSEAPAKEKSKSKKSKKSKDSEPSTDITAPSSTSAEGKDDKKARRDAKKARKLERLTKKESKKSKEKRREKKEKRKDSSSEDSSSEDEGTTSVSVSAPDSGTSTPAQSFAGGRLAVRQRYIAQKKKASMDPQALKEIFMIKAEA